MREPVSDKNDGGEAAGDDGEKKGAAPVNRALRPSLRGGAVLPGLAREFLAWRRSLCEGPLYLQLLPLRR
jgi:hypothetical protein